MSDKTTREGGSVESVTSDEEARIIERSKLAAEFNFQRTMNVAQAFKERGSLSVQDLEGIVAKTLIEFKDRIDALGGKSDSPE